MSIAVYVDPTPGTLAATSHSMLRVSRALREFAPKNVDVVSRVSDADLQVLHVIGADSRTEQIRSQYAVLQYCWGTAGAADWQTFWQNAKSVWSYYRLPTPKLYYAPLGVDGSVFKLSGTVEKTTDILTSGFVSGPHAEAIEEVAEAAARLKRKVFHLGPSNVQGMAKRREHTWQNGIGITDAELNLEYQKARFVSGLRHIEAFEFPVIEGLACGARPIVFDRPEMRQWFAGYAIFIPECHGEPLVKQIMSILSGADFPVRRAERDVVVEKFSWAKLVQGFWKDVLR